MNVGFCGQKQIEQEAYARILDNEFLETTVSFKYVKTQFAEDIHLPNTDIHYVHI